MLDLDLSDARLVLWEMGSDCMTVQTGDPGVSEISSVSTPLACTATDDIV